MSDDVWALLIGLGWVCGEETGGGWRCCLDANHAGLHATRGGKR